MTTSEQSVISSIHDIHDLHTTNINRLQSWNLYNETQLYNVLQTLRLYAVNLFNKIENFTADYKALQFYIIIQNYNKYKTLYNSTAYRFTAQCDNFAT